MSLSLLIRVVNLWNRLVVISACAFVVGRASNGEVTGAVRVSCIVIRDYILCDGESDDWFLNRWNGLSSAFKLRIETPADHIRLLQTKRL